LKSSENAKMTDLFSAAQIIDMRDRPDLRSAVIEQNLKVWGDFTGIDRAGMERLFDPETPKESLPITLLAIVDGRYAGCVSLRDRSMGMMTHPEEYLDETPWLSNMWVDEFARGAKLASRLTIALEDQARKVGIAKIFSSTMDPNSLYHKLGYKDLVTKDHRGAPIYMICKEL
jgi:GNAT superfamily N-acetyltransferase